jgi:hypothetical protein
MLIRMDGLMATSASANPEKILSMRLAKPSIIMSTNPMPQQDFKQNLQGQPTVRVSEAADVI